MPQRWPRWPAPSLLLSLMPHVGHSFVRSDWCVYGEVAGFYRRMNDAIRNPEHRGHVGELAALYQVRRWIALNDVSFVQQRSCRTTVTSPGTPYTDRHGSVADAHHSSDLRRCPPRSSSGTGSTYIGMGSTIGWKVITRSSMRTPWDSL